MAYSIALPVLSERADLGANFRLLLCPDIDLRLSWDGEGVSSV